MTEPVMVESAPAPPPDILDQMGIDIAPPELPEPTSGSRDILDEMGISTPNIEQRNSDALNSAVNLGNPKNDNEAQIAKDFEVNQNEIMTVAKMYHTPEQIEFFKKNPYTISDTFDALKQADITPGGGFYSGAEALYIKSIVEKQNRGEEVSASEGKRVDDYLKSYTEHALRGTTIGGGIAQTLAQAPAFAFEFLATGGVGKLAQTAVLKTTEKVIAKAAVTRAAGLAANVAARTSVGSVAYGSAFQGYGERRLNDFMVITDKGELIFEKSKEAPLKSALMAFGYSSIEFGTEMAGAGIGKRLVSPAANVLKTPLVSAVNKLPVNIRSNIYRAYKTLNPNASVSKVMTAAGWNGMLEEMGEERLGQVLSATLGAAGGDVKSFDDWLDKITPSKDQLLIEAGAIGIAGSVKKSADVTFNILKNKGVKADIAKDMVDNMSANEQDQFIEKNLVKPVSGYDVASLDIVKEDEVLPVMTADEVASEREQDVLTPEDAAAMSEQARPANIYADVDTKISSMDLSQRQMRLESLNKKMEAAIITPKEMYEREALSSERYTLRPSTAEEMDVGVSKPGRVVYAIDKNNEYSGFIDIDNITDGIARIGDIMIMDKSGKTVNSVGPSVIRSLLKDLRGKHPEITGFSGWRASGVRTGGRLTFGKEGKEITVNLPMSQRAEDLADGLPVAESPILEMAATQVKAAEKADPPPINDKESILNKIYRQWFDDLAPIAVLEELSKKVGASINAWESPILLSRMYAGTIARIQSNIQVATDIKGTDLNLKVTGKSLKATLDDFDNMFIVTEPSRDQRQEDFSDYLIAQRYLQDLSAKEGVTVTQEQKAKSLSDLARLEDKYGDDFEFFKTFAEEIYSFQKRVLENLVIAGNMSRKKYNEIVKENPNYIPFDRVFEDETFAAITNNGLFTGADSKKIIKKIHGSEREIKNVFHSIIKNTARIMDYAARNEVAKSIAAMADYLPEYVQKTDIPVVKKGTAEIKVTYDKKLRAKLEGAIQLLGGRLERMKSIKVKGMSNVLGSYSPAERAIRLKIGTTEGTLAHEVGHMLDYVFGLKEKMLNIPKVKAELVKLAKQRLPADIKAMKDGGDIRFRETVMEVGTQKYNDYITNDDEILANFYDAYVNSPTLAKEIAPTAYKEFEKLIKSTPEMAFLQDIKPSTERGEEIIQQDVYGTSPFVPPNTIVVFKEGKKEYYRVAEPLYKAATAIGPVELGWLEKAFAYPNTVLVVGATITPDFMARSIIRESHTAMVLSGVTVSPANLARGLFGVFSKITGKNDLYKQWQASGGKFNSYMELNDRSLEKAYEELLNPKGKFVSYLKNPLGLLKDLGTSFDEVPRIAIYDAAKKRGYSDIEAAYVSRDIYDYTRGGSIAKKINRYVPFFKAGLNGSDKLVRAFKKNPKAATFWSLATITIPSIALTGYYLYGADDDERAEYLEHPEVIRDLFWLYKVNGEWHKHPKPFQVGWLFGTLPEKMMIWMYEGDKPEGRALWKETMFGVAGAVSPIYDANSLMPTIAKLFAEPITNYNFYYGRDIYPSWMERLPPEQRTNKYTSETAQAIGKKAGISPALIDNSIRGALAGSGTYLTDAGDKILSTIKKMNGEAVPLRPTTDADIPILRAFAQRRPAGYRSNSAGNFFDTWHDVQEKHAGYNKLVRDGEAAQSREYFAKNKEIINQYKPMKAYYDQMRDTQEQVDAIYEHKTMTAEQKVERINTLEDSITEIARTANRYFKKAKAAKDD